MKNLFAGFLFALACFASPASAQTCNDPSGFIKAKGPIPLGDTVVMGPDCQSVQDGGVPSGGGGQFISGRLTLTTGVAIMQTSVAAATRVYFTPYAGFTVPIGNGVSVTPQVFSEVFQDITDTTKSPAAVVANSCYDEFAWLDAGTFRVTRGPVWTSLQVRSAGTALTSFKGNLFNSVGITNGPSALNGTYVGTICSNATATIDWIFGAPGAGGVASFFGIWNINSVDVEAVETENTNASWTYGVAAWASGINGAQTMRTTWARGLNIEGVQFEYYGFCGPPASTNCAVGLWLNQLAGPFTISGTPGTALSNGATAGPHTQIVAKYSGLPGLGYNFIQASVYTAGTLTTFQLFFAPYLITGLHTHIRN